MEDEKQNLNIYMERRRILIVYLDMKMKENDWHAVADAAMDLRELEIYIRLAK